LFSRNAKFYEWLPAYLEDGLDPAQRGLMTARLAADPALAAEAERLRPLIQALRESKTREASAPASSAVPGDLWLRLSDRLNPVPAPRPTRQYGWLAGVGATAALAVIVALRLPQSMPTETHPTAPVQQTVPGDRTRSGDVKIAKTNPPPTVHPPTATDALNNAVNGSGLPPHPVPSAKLVPPPVTITKGNDPFAAPSAPNSTQETFAQPRPLPVPVRVPAPVSVAGAAPGQPRADRARAVGASEADSFHVAGEVSVNGPPPPVPAPSMTDAVPPASTQGEAVATAPTPTHRDVPMNAYQVQAAPTKPQAPPAKPQTKPRVLRKAPVLAMDQARAASPSLETEQAALSAATQPPLWGESDGTNQANQALMTVRESGQLDTLRGKLEAARSRSPRSLGTGRMLAAVYEFGFQSELTVAERRRIVGLDGAGGEDWFALAVAEERAGNGQAAKAAYRRALELPGTLNSFHASAARQRQ